MPHQLHSIDRVFLDLDTPEIDMGVTPIYIYDSKGLPNSEFCLKDIVNHIDSCVRSIPVLFGKLHRTPMDLDNPYLVHDEHYNVRNHVHHYTMDDSSCIKELSRLITDFQEFPIDTTRPLWSVMIISGINVRTLPKDSFLIALKIHHSVADGMTVMDLSSKIHGLVSTADQVELESASKLTAGGLPGLLTRIVFNNVKQTLNMVTPLVKIAPRLSIETLNYYYEQLANKKQAAPVTRFAGEVSNKRAWGFSSLDMKELNKVRALVPSATLNDVILTVIAGSMREYLIDKNELPDSAIKSVAPINVRKPEEQGIGGNEISFMSVSLPVQIEDPLERLMAVMKASVKAKEMQKRLGARDMSEIARNIPAFTLTTVNRIVKELKAKNVMGQLGNQFGNNIITNVVGPKKKLNLLGAELITMSGILPVTDGMGLVHAIISYNGTVTINVVSCKEMIPDIKYYMQCVDRSYERLIDSAQQRYSTVIAPAVNETKATTEA